MIDLRHPLLIVARRNRSVVSDFEFRVLAVAVPALEAAHARELKLEQIAIELAVDRSNVSRAVRRLVGAGFLIRVDRADHNGAWRYRLPRTPDLGLSE